MGTNRSQEADVRRLTNAYEEVGPKQSSNYDPIH